MNKKIAIVMICDTNYVVPTCVAITSMIENKKSESIYHIHILTDNLTEDDKRVFNTFNSDTVIISIIEGNMEKLKNLHNSKSKNSYCVATEAALLKFEIPNLIPEYDRIIYLDGDIICRKDLTGLYNTNMTTQYAAVVLDSGKMYSNRELVKQTRKYFNSGVMLLNLDKMRAENLTDTLIKTKKEMTDKSLMDQNVLNVVFGENTKLLPIKYNFLYINLLRAKKNKYFTMQQLNEMYGTNYEDLDSIRKDSVIIHFSSKDKPWKYYDVRLADEWFNYFMLSPVKNVQLNRKSLRENELQEKVKKQEKKIKNLQKQLENKDKTIADLSYHIDETWKSMSMRIGRTATVVPRYLRSQMEHFIEEKEKIKYLLPSEEVLNRETRKNPVIVSLTTYSIRINTVAYTIASIMHQTVKPDRIILYLASDEFNENNIPSMLKKQRKLGLEIKFCDDLKSHKKYYYSMKDNPNAIIVTVDDDIIYQNDLLEKLLESYKRFPDCVSAMRVHRMKFKDGKLCSYNEWKQRDKSQILEPMMDLFPTGCGGVLYPPHILHQDVFNKKDIKGLCLNGDDIWLKIMAVKNNKKTVLAAWQEPLEYIDGTQSIGLFNQNVNNNKNDEMLENVINKYFKENEFYNILMGTNLEN